LLEFYKMGWSLNSGVACYDGNDENTLSSPGVLTPGENYYVEIEVTGTGSIKLSCFESNPIITEASSGIFQATQSSFTITGIGEVCVDNIIVTQAYDYVIKDQLGNVVYTSTPEDVDGSGFYLRYKVNWEDLPDGCYTIEMNDGLEYVSECFYVKLEHECTILVTWTNNESAFGFDYSGLDFTQSLRVPAKLWQPKYNSDIKEIYVDSKGNRQILYARVVKDQLLSVKELPEYLHDALSIGINHDIVKLDGVEYVFEEDEYSPTWRNSSNLAPVLLRAIKKNQNLINSNCG
jgi:hypothetical protein